MTTPALGPDAFRETLESAGWRCTRQRRAVYDFLAAAPRHPSAEEVYQAVKPGLPRISLATVYKALEALVASGLATKLTAVDGSARYDTRGDGHYHLRCLRTGTIEDLPTAYDADLLARLDPELTDHLARRGFHLTGYRLELVGFFEPASDLGASEIPGQSDPGASPS